MRIETLTVRGYRALRDVTMKDFSPLGAPSAQLWSEGHLTGTDPQGL